MCCVLQKEELRSHVVAVEGVKDAGDVAAQDADGDAGVVQRHPAAAGLLRAVAAEQVVAHRAQQAQLRRGGGEEEEKIQGSEKYLALRRRRAALCNAASQPLNISPAEVRPCGPTAGQLLSSRWLRASANIMGWARMSPSEPVHVRVIGKRNK